MLNRVPIECELTELFLQSQR